MPSSLHQGSGQYQSLHTSLVERTRIILQLYPVRGFLSVGLGLEENQVTFYHRTTAPHNFGAPQRPQHSACTAQCWSSTTPAAVASMWFKRVA